MPARTSTDLPQNFEHMRAIKARRSSTPRLLRGRLRGRRLRHHEPTRRLRRFPTRYPRSGAWSSNASPSATPTASGASTRWSSTTTLLRLPPGIQRRRRPETGHGPRLRHADFFKNNAWFARPQDDRPDGQPRHAQASSARPRPRRAPRRVPPSSTSSTRTRCSSGEEPRTPARRPGPDAERDDLRARPLPRQALHGPVHQPAREMGAAREDPPERGRGKFPAEPTRDVLLPAPSRALEAWQQDVLSIVRRGPTSRQAMTKIMNEGWASYWHSKLMTRHFATDAEIVQYADQHSVRPPAARRLQPLQDRHELFRDIERAGTPAATAPPGRLRASADSDDDKSMKGEDLRSGGSTTT